MGRINKKNNFEGVTEVSQRRYFRSISQEKRKKIEETIKKEMMFRGDQQVDWQFEISIFREPEIVAK